MHAKLTRNGGLKSINYGFSRSVTKQDYYRPPHPQQTSNRMSHVEVLVAMRSVLPRSTRVDICESQKDVFGRKGVWLKVRNCITLLGHSEHW
mmetsp:Transcript_64524/g.76396  ORF Transcript_64524/g.76396 Transcript_64524/m.76396 type:complete len:92 (-) Transcript_64524:232-507(-)